MLVGSGSNSVTSDTRPREEWQRNHSTPSQSGTPASFNSESLTPGPGHSTVPRHRITKADEELFLSGAEAKGNDPLLVRAQFVKTVLDILHSPSTLPYFVQFLQGLGADKYARFWLEANSFRAAAITRSAPPTSPARSTTLTSETPAGIADRLKEESHPSKAKTHSRDAPRDLILPDLVSNIQYASDVTPLGSPEGVTPDALTCHTPRQDLGSEVKEDCGGSNDTSVSDDNVFSAQTEEQTVAGDSCGAEDGRLRAQKLRKSIIEDALTIFKKYLAKNADFPLGVEEDIVELISCRISAFEDVDPGCFVPAQEAVIGILERE
ncbi:A-kinase anchor protein 10, mitochondrial [Portunus trituberculatus]|uniref:A-kinase anchor protein 10, mitochondrial n=1 Tax=Portunus trituberculatus TaxID=210409 RepID=A0A5B7DZM8_PORTR|nr:A-kinase anchor protein 10, mitochondrial [Portunus trituberculatus]